MMGIRLAQTLKVEQDLRRELGGRVQR
jgi:hypothetical protein